MHKGGLKPRYLTLKRAGSRTDVSWAHKDGARRSLNYCVPNVNQSRDCYERSGTPKPISLKARNRLLAYLMTVEITKKRAMPELGRANAHAEGVDLLRERLATMPTW